MNKDVFLTAGVVLFAFVAAIYFFSAGLWPLGIFSLTIGAIVAIFGVIYFIVLEDFFNELRQRSQKKADNQKFEEIFGLSTEANQHILASRVRGELKTRAIELERACQAQDRLAHIPLCICISKKEAQERQQEFEFLVKELRLTKESFWSAYNLAKKVYEEKRSYLLEIEEKSWKDFVDPLDE